MDIIGFLVWENVFQHPTFLSSWSFYIYLIFGTQVFIYTKALPNKGVLCKVSLKLVQWLWRRWFLKHSTLFSLFPIYLHGFPIWRGPGTYLNNLENVWLKFNHWLCRRWKYIVFTMTTTEFWSENISQAFGSCELKMFVIYWINKVQNMSKFQT